MKKNYDNITSFMINRCSILEKELSRLKKKKNTNVYFEKKLKISKRGEKFYYYLLCSNKHKKPRYIKYSDIEIAKNIAQQDYEEKIIRNIEKELNSTKTYLRNIPDQKYEDIYDSLIEGRKAIVTPVVMTNDEYVRKWQDEKYIIKQTHLEGVIFETQRGEKVRSKSEVIIADALYYAGVPYHYEKPLKIGNKVIYPDFTVLNVRTRKEYYWEHLGMLDNEDYLDKALRKLDSYELHGIREGNNLILTRETAKFPINISNVKDKINYYLK